MIKDYVKWEDSIGIMCTIGGLGRHIGQQSTDISVNYRSAISQLLVNYRSTISRQLTDYRSAVDQQLTDSRPIVDRYIDR